MNKKDLIKRLESKHDIKVIKYNLIDKRIIFEKDGRKWDISANSLTKCKWSFKSLSYDSQKDVLNEQHFKNSVCKITEVQKNIVIIQNTSNGRKIKQRKSAISTTRAEYLTISLDKS